MGNTKSEKNTKYISLAFVFVVIISLAYILWAHREYKEDLFVFDDESVVEWGDAWDINYDGNVSQDITIPTEVPAKRGSSVILRKSLPDKIKTYNCILIESNRQDIIVSIGGIERASYSNEGYRPWGKTSPSGIVMVPLYNTDALADVAIHISSDSMFSGKIGNIYLGNEKSLVMMILKSNLPWFLLTVIALIMGIVCEVCYFAYAGSFKISKAMHYLAMFALLSTVWGISQSGLRQLFVNNLTTIEAIGYCCYMLIPIPFMLYFNSVIEAKYVRIVNGYLSVAMLGFVAQNVVQAVARIGFFEMRYISQGIFIAGILLVLVLAIVEAIKKGNKAFKSLIIGTLGLLVGVIADIVFSYVSFLEKGYFNVFIGGAMVFLASGFVYTALCVSNEQRQRKDIESANNAKNLFLATMSHEIKTPINAVLGMNEMIMRDTSEDNIREYASNISEAGKSLLALVNDILDYSRIESGKMNIETAQYQMNSLLRDLVIMTESKVKPKDLKVELKIDENLPASCIGDKVRLKQVLSNMLTNAVKYTQQGTITFSVQSIAKENDEVALRFSVGDTGAGIRESDLSKFMESFGRSDQVKNSNIGGLGLGLTISSQLLELMGSRLQVESVYGEGSEFFFIIKQKLVDDSKLGAFRVRPERADTKRNKFTFTAPEVRVLGVDDNTINLKVLEGILKPTEIKVDLCDSGMKCLDACKDNYYDIIFMDHMMPEMDGIEAFKRIRADKSLKSTDSACIVLTANTVSGAADEYREAGFDYYMKKPLDIMELNDVLLKYLPKEKVKLS